MDDDASDLRAKGTDFMDERVCLLLLQVVPEERDVFWQRVDEREKEPFALSRLMKDLRARYDLSRKLKSDAALVASGSRRWKSV